RDRGDSRPPDHDRGTDGPALLPPLVLTRTDRRAVRQEDRQERDQQSTNHRRPPPRPGRFPQPSVTICDTVHRSAVANERPPWVGWREAGSACRCVAHRGRLTLARAGDAKSHWSPTTRRAARPGRL